VCSVAFRGARCPGVDYVYLSADGIHVDVRPDEERLRLLLLIGLRGMTGRS
jgi:putative transposase